MVNFMDLNLNINLLNLLNYLYYYFIIKHQILIN